MCEHKMRLRENRRKREEEGNDCVEINLMLALDTDTLRCSYSQMYTHLKYCKWENVKET